ncbi:MAG: hypothetical protein SF070_03930 [Gemmatimonadota bacterium]|nr:hypothetical protein [Gemmatimonadota bacterium]
MTHRFRSLDPALIVGTAHTLERRIAERFPQSGLSRVAADLAQVAEETSARITVLRQPRWGIRLATGVVVLLLLTVVAFAILALGRPAALTDLGAFVQLLESAINDVVFLGIAIAFLVTIEGRLRRREALAALHELRSLVHIVDMHQLTKDPDQFLPDRAPTTSSPERLLTPGQLTRYLDYCSEMLSIAGKVAALYAQQLDDPVVLAAVNELEALTTGLSSKIWQKIVILGTTVRTPLGPSIPPG